MARDSAQQAAVAQQEAKAAEAGQASKDAPPAAGAAKAARAAPPAAPASVARNVVKPTMAALLAEFIQVHSSTHVMLPGILALALIALVIPLTTAACERGFSTLKRIKTRLRSLLAQETLDHCIRVSEEAPDLSDYDWSRAIEVFFTMRQRRVSMNAK